LICIKFFDCISLVTARRFPKRLTGGKTGDAIEEFDANQENVE